MTLTYSLSEEDYLQSQLYISSKSERVRKQRKRRWIWVTALLFFLSIISYDEGFLFYYFLIIGIISVFFYPKYTAFLYKRHYKKYVADIHKNSFNEICNITFTEEVIETEDRTGTSKINLTELENISETGSYFYLKLKTGPHLIIPKAKLNNIDDVRSHLQSLSKKLNINFISDLNWKWK